jgi:hypothetical protein
MPGVYCHNINLALLFVLIDWVAGNNISPPIAKELRRESKS